MFRPISHHQTIIKTSQEGARSANNIYVKWDAIKLHKYVLHYLYRFVSYVTMAWWWSADQKMSR